MRCLLLAEATGNFSLTCLSLSQAIRVNVEEAETLWPPSRRQQDLFRILKAYTVYRPDEGYCQAQAPVAAVLLMHMPAEVRGARLRARPPVRGSLFELTRGCSSVPQQAFWCLVQICEKYLPGYYSAGLVSTRTHVWLGFISIFHLFFFASPPPIRRPSSWTVRSFSLCYAAPAPWPTATSRSSRSTRSST